MDAKSRMYRVELTEGNPRNDDSRVVASSVVAGIGKARNLVDETRGRLFASIYNEDDGECVAEYFPRKGD